MKTSIYVVWKAQQSADFETHVVGTWHKYVGNIKGSIVNSDKMQGPHEKM